MAEDVMSEAACDRFLHDLTQYAIERGMAHNIVVEAITVAGRSPLNEFTLVINAGPNMGRHEPPGTFHKPEDRLRAAEAIRNHYSMQGMHSVWGEASSYYLARKFGQPFRSAARLYRYYGIEYHNASNRYRALVMRIACAQFELIPLPKDTNTYGRGMLRYSPSPGDWNFMDDEACAELEEYLAKAQPRQRTRKAVGSSDGALMRKIFEW